MTTTDLTAVVAPANVTVPDFVDFEQTYTLDDTYTITADYCTYSKKSTPMDFWLVEDGCPVGYVKVLNNAVVQYGVDMIVCDIEVHPARRRSGLAMRMVRAIETITGHTMHTSGGFTPDGFAALSGRIPVSEENQRWNGENGSVQYSQQTFVNNWETFEPRRSC